MYIFFIVIVNMKTQECQTFTIFLKILTFSKEILRIFDSISCQVLKWKYLLISKEILIVTKKKKKCLLMCVHEHVSQKGRKNLLRAKTITQGVSNSHAPLT